MAAFLAVADARSFVRADKALGLTQSGVSRAIARLGERVHIRLFQRTYLSLLKNGYSTGQTVIVDGGAVLGRVGGTCAACRARMRILDDATSRRSFFATAAAAVALAACKGPPKDAPKEGTVALPSKAETTAAMPRRPLGKTGETVSLVGIGGFHIGSAKDDAEATKIVRTALDRGINFLDNCWDYHDGLSEKRMGAALTDGYRNKAFLMTKLDGRTKKAAAEQLDQSLQRLRTDHIDLVQVHEVIRMTDPVRVFADGGTMEALLEAKKAGKLRFIGFTGHKDPQIHLAMLKAADEHGFAFDTVQMPLNVMDAHYKSFANLVLPVAQAKGMGILGMKSMGAGKILESKTVTPVECLHYAMNLPTSVVITGCDSVGVLEQAIQAALTFKPMSQAEVDAILAKTKDAAQNGAFESFKTTSDHDSTAHKPEWLETSRI